jgi:hypothetical protein
VSEEPGQRHRPRLRSPGGRRWRVVVRQGLVPPWPGQAAPGGASERAAEPATGAGSKADGTVFTNMILIYIIG